MRYREREAETDRQTDRQGGGFLRRDMTEGSSVVDVTVNL